MMLLSKRSLLPLTVAAVVLAGCASGTQGTLYRCEQGLDFRVRFVDDSALLDGTRGSAVLFRDAGGQGAAQSVYSSPQMRAEFGLGTGGREASVRYPALPLALRCVRD